MILLVSQNLQNAFESHDASKSETLQFRRNYIFSYDWAEQYLGQMDKPNLTNSTQDYLTQIIRLLLRTLLLTTYFDLYYH